MNLTIRRSLTSRWQRSAAVWVSPWERRTAVPWVTTCEHWCENRPWAMVESDPVTRSSRWMARRSRRCRTRKRSNSWDNADRRWSCGCTVIWRKLRSRHCRRQSLIILSVHHERVWGIAFLRFVSISLSYLIFVEHCDWRDDCRKYRKKENLSVKKINWRYNGTSFRRRKIWHYWINYTNWICYSLIIR